MSKKAKGPDQNENNTVAANRLAHEQKEYIRYLRLQGYSYQDISEKFAEIEKAKEYEKLGKREIERLKLTLNKER